MSSRPTRSRQNTLAFLVAAIVLHCSPIGIAQTPQGDATPTAVDRLVTLLRSRPTDELLLARVVDWGLERESLDDILVSLTPSAHATDPEREGEATTRAEEAVDAHLRARILQEAGDLPGAFDAYEQAVATGHALPDTVRRFTLLLLRAGWADRARAVWSEGAPGSCALEVGEIEFRLRHRLGSTSAAEHYLREELDEVEATTRAEWARDVGSFALASDLWEQAGRPADAFTDALRSGDAQRATWLWREHRLQVSDAHALQLARLLGDRDLLERHLAERTDDAAQRLRAQLSLSLGWTSRPAAAGEVDSGGVSEATTLPGPTIVGPTPTPPDDLAGRGDERRLGPPAKTNPALDLARQVIATASATEEERTRLATADAVQLEFVLAWLVLGDEERARRAWTRWRLSDDPTPTPTLVQRIRDRAPDWFEEGAGSIALASSPEDVLHQLESLPAPTSTDPAGAGRSSVAIERRLQRTLAEVAAGTPIEAQLLYHRGRLFGAHDDLRRASAIDPDARVTEIRGSVRVRTSLANAVARLLGNENDANEPPEIQIPNPIDATIAVLNGRVASLGRYPFGVREHPGTWFLDRWERASPQTAALDGLAWNADGATLPNGETWVAGGVAPIHSAVRLPGAGWVLVGRGIVVLGERAPIERSRVEFPSTLDLRALPTAITDALSPALAVFVSGLQTARVPGWKGADDFLRGVRVWRADPTVEWSAALADGEGLLLRTTTGERVWLDRSQDSATVRFFGYTSRDDGCLVMNGRPVPSSPRVRARPPVQLPDPPVRRGEFTLEWRRETPLPDPANPWIEALGPSQPIERRLPEVIREEVVIARVGDDPAVRVTSGGHVLYYEGDEAYPLWIRRIATPLPGSHGFPTPPLPPRLEATFDRGPHRSRPAGDARSPRVELVRDGVLVLTDRIHAFDWSGRAWTFEVDGAGTGDGDGFEIRAVAGPVFEPARSPDEALLATGFSGYRALVASRRGADTWIGFLPGGREPASGDDSPAIRIPAESLPGITNGFDMEAIDDRTFVLGVHLGEFALWEYSALDESVRSLPLPPLTLENDREGLCITSLGTWITGSEPQLLLVHEALYAGRLAPLGANPAAAPDIQWSSLLAWPDRDSRRQVHYAQTRPVGRGGRITISRPWGVVESWRHEP